MTKVVTVVDVLDEILALPKDQKDLVALVYLRGELSLREALATVLNPCKGD